ncbi:hypothetical protein [Azorhizobium sp. AG788]|uniref:hypothetical protein n=1 Tax=Azorhizobium sp. AG788 TaxID=2183897 RepID=UPI0031391B44
MGAPSSAPLAKVFVLDVAGVRQAALIKRIAYGEGRERCRVHIRGDVNVRSVDPALVFADEDVARAHWRRACSHRAELERAGCRIRVIDAHLSLALADRELAL